MFHRSDVAAGFVIDEAVVVIENIARHLEEGETPLQAALKGSSEIGFTIMSPTMSLVAVLIALLFMRGIIGRLFREFAITMSVAVLISLVISLTATPMIASRVLRRSLGQSRFADVVARLFDRAHRQYARSLDWALANRGAMLNPARRHDRAQRLPDRHREQRLLSRAGYRIAARRPARRSEHFLPAHAKEARPDRPDHPR